MKSIRVLLHSTIRFYGRHRLQLILMITGIALGVAVYCGVRIANDSAQGAFDASAELFRGGATHRILPVGSDLDDNFYATRIATSGINAAPILEGIVSIGDGNLRQIPLRGIAPLEELSFGDPQRLLLLNNIDITTLIAKPGTAVVIDGLNEVIPSADETLTIESQAGIHDLEIVSRITQHENATASILTDISTAQDLLGKSGRLSRIDLKLSDDDAESLREVLLNDAILVDAAKEDSAFIALSDAFTTNILALSLLALAIGMFMVYSTVNFSIVQRTKSLALFRTLGVHGSEIIASVIIEIIVIGLCGSLLGIVLGNVLAASLTNMVLGTVDDFSFRTAALANSGNTTLTLQSLGIGICATVIAAITPIYSLVHNSPSTNLNRAHTERVSKKTTTRAIYIALGLICTGMIFLLLPSRNLTIAFTGLFFVLAACACLIPGAMLKMTRLLSRLVNQSTSPTTALALRNLEGQHSRLAVASAALCLAVATVIGIGVLIESFRSSLSDWLETTLTSDIYIQVPFQENIELEHDQWIESLHSDQRIEALSLSRFSVLPTELGEVRLRAFEPGARGWGVDILSQGDLDAELALESGHYIAVTEPFAYRHSLAPGDQLNLPTASGQQPFEITAIYRDYNAGGAGILIGLQTYRRLWSDYGIDGVGIEIHDRQHIEAVANDIRNSAVSIRVTTNRDIKAISMRIFDRTFEITGVLRWIAGIVAFFGVLSSLLAIHLSRYQEFAILHAIGFSRRGVSRLILTESSLVGVFAGLAAIPIGILLAALLVYVINLRSFGWSLSFVIPPGPIVTGIAMAVIAACFAGIAPALQTLGKNRTALLSALFVLGACTGNSNENETVQTPLNGIKFLSAAEDNHDFERAIEAREFIFPRDHGMHPSYRNEWWYFTGNIESEDGEEFGFELTFFRLAIASTAEADENSWRTNQVFVAHFAITDLSENKFVSTEKFGRHAKNIASASHSSLDLQLENWSIKQIDSDERFRLRAIGGEYKIDLILEAVSPIIKQGRNGLDIKGPEPGNASYYYSIPRLSVAGTLQTPDKRTRTVSGLAWLDREWGTSALSVGVIGWDWFALHLESGTNLMYYQLRQSDNTSSPFSGGSLSDNQGNQLTLLPNEVKLSAVRQWRSPISRVSYPIEWEIEIPSQEIALRIIPKLDNQELLHALRYWEGAVTVIDTATNEPIGSGYLELAGY